MQCTKRLTRIPGRASAAYVATSTKEQFEQVVPRRYPAGHRARYCHALARMPDAIRPGMQRLS